MMAAATTVKVNNATDSDAGPPRRCSSTGAAHRGARPRARRGRVGVQPGRRRRRARAGAAGERRGDRRRARSASATLALFAAYLGWLSFLPRMVGRVLARRKQAGVAFDRMRRLVADEDAQQHGHAPLAADRGAGSGRPARRPCGPERVPLERLDVVDGRRRRYPGGAASCPTLVHRRAGQLHGPHRRRSGPASARCCGRSSGWRSRPRSPARCGGTARSSTDRGAFFVPPNAAFLSQVPQLVSDSVRDNVALGPMDTASCRPRPRAGRDRRRRRRDARRPRRR